MINILREYTTEDNVLSPKEYLDLLTAFNSRLQYSVKGMPNTCIDAYTVVVLDRLINDCVIEELTGEEISKFIAYLSRIIFVYCLIDKYRTDDDGIDRLVTELATYFYFKFKAPYKETTNAESTIVARNNDRVDIYEFIKEIGIDKFMDLYNKQLNERINVIERKRV